MFVLKGKPIENVEWMPDADAGLVFWIVGRWMCGYKWKLLNLDPACVRSGFPERHYRVVVHVRRSEEPVGDSAVREMLDAMRLYNAPLGIVVTNSMYDDSAYELMESETLHFDELQKEQASSAAEQSESRKRIVLVSRHNLYAFAEGEYFAGEEEILALPVSDFFAKQTPEFQSILYSVDVDDWGPSS